MSSGRTHRPQHDATRCMTCGGCTWQCPATVFPSLRSEEGSLRGELYRSRVFPGEMATHPPCVMACPLGQDVPGYISAIARSDVDEAATIVRRTNALPSVCGRVCIASCMRACTRAGIDMGVDIRSLKRFAVQAAAGTKVETKDVEGRDGVGPVAIVGSGPAGLAAAHRLSQLGVRSVVFDAGVNPGGSMADTVPRFVLPREMVAADVTRLEKMGVEFHSGTRIGEDMSWSDLESSFKVVLVATGARQDLAAAFPGSGLKNVVGAAEYCRNDRRMDGEVVVNGGGPAAVQAARLAVRLGARRAIVIHPVPLEQWPAGDNALELAREEGVEVRPMHRITKAQGPAGTLAAVLVKAVRAQNPDGVGRHTLTSHGPVEQLEAGLLIVAGERRSPAADLPDLDGISRGVLGNLLVDEGYRLGRERWYAAGESATGAATVVDSMATGRLAAETIHHDLKLGN
jgi:NADPH-dependent glutamate synthase beta subunit-like oxidoreductase